MSQPAEPVTGWGGSLDRVNAAPLFLAGALSQYLGAAVAVGLFDSVEAGGVAWLRIGFATVIVAAISRPSWRRWQQWTRNQVALVAAFGMALALMNVSFYLAIDRLPLGTAVAIEFSGPVAVAAFGTRTKASAVALLTVIAGVLLLADVEWEASPEGVLWALGAAVGWAGYIVLGRRVAQGAKAGDSLTAAFVVAAAVTAPFLLTRTGDAFGSASLLTRCAAVGLLSSAVPYALDQIVLRAMSSSTFALLQAVLPLMATAIGVALLGERPSQIELAGIGLVVLGLTLRALRRAPDGGGGSPLNSGLHPGPEESAGVQPPREPIE